MATVPGGTRASLREQLLRRKPVTVMAEETGADTGKGELERSLGLFQLSLFGIGATIGTGIFIVLTEAVPITGPSVILSFVFAGTVAGLTAICYAELASAVPVSGSSYSAVHIGRRHTAGEGADRTVGRGDRGGGGGRARTGQPLPAVPRRLETVIGYGESWEEALEDVDWQDGDVLVVGSSSMGPLARVFLGSRASKIVRHSPVPVVVVPRARAAELAEEAVRE